jgi:hypothetical protein
VTTVIAQRVRNLGGQTLKSVSHITTRAMASPTREMIAGLLQDNQSLTAEIKTLHALCDATGDSATASLLEDWIDEADGRAWLLVFTSGWVSNLASSLLASERTGPVGDGHGCGHDHHPPTRSWSCAHSTRAAGLAPAV